MRIRLFRAMALSAISALPGLALIGCHDNPAQPRSGPVDHLVWLVQPVNTVSSQPITPAPEVALVDAAGRTVTSATDMVTIGLGSNVGIGTLSGTTMVGAQAGVARFTNLSIDKATRPGDTLYILVATSGTLMQAVSADFSISPGAPKRLAFANQPPASTPTRPFGPAVSVVIQDAGGNTIFGATGAVTITLTNNTTGATLTGTTTVNSTDSGAYFTDLGVNKVGVGYTLAASSGSLSSASSAPFQIWPSMGTAAAISTGVAYSCAVATTGAAFCWGDNRFGQLGDGTLAGRPAPLPVSGGLTFATISGMYYHTCGVTTAADAYCWGNNPDGRLGNGTTSATPITAPAKVVGGHSFAVVSAGAHHSCGITTAGEAYCWGDNSYGQLGDGGYTNSSSPVLVAGLHVFAAISAGAWHTCGVDNSGIAYCWGSSPHGGLGLTASSPSPVAVTSPPGAYTFATIASGWDFTCGVTTSGDAYCWGWNGDGELGNGTFNHYSQTPTIVSGGSIYSRYTSADFITCGVTTGGDAYCAGLNGYGELGNGTVTDSPTPTLVTSSHKFSAIGAGRYHACALTTAGQPYCWGDNEFGQLGTLTIGGISATSTAVVP